MLFTLRLFLFRIFSADCKESCIVFRYLKCYLPLAYFFLYFLNSVKKAASCLDISNTFYPSLNSFDIFCSL